VIATLIDPGVHGLDVAGMHGCGVRTPLAAAVAAATCGLSGDWHIPKDAMFTIGLMSCTVAAGFEPPYVSFVGKTESDDGLLPIAQARVAP
jgi:hypothetical protein